MADQAEFLAYRIMSSLPEVRRGEFMAAFMAQRKDRNTALLLSLFGGLFGIDRFYLGQTGLAVCKLLFCWATCGIWKIIDWFFIMDATDRYNLQVLSNLQSYYGVADAMLAPPALTAFGTPQGFGAPPPQGYPPAF